MSGTAAPQDARHGPSAAPEDRAPGDRLTGSIIFGFDSAWTDRPDAPGAICAVGFPAGGGVALHPPRLTSFAQAADFIAQARQGFCLALVALDQPSIVPNATGMRPVDRLACAVVNFAGGGVQPANRGKTGMFCEAAPLWGFLDRLGAVQDPFRARAAATGVFLVEVFPALALPGLDARFARRLGAPKYNPAHRRKFRPDDWRAVADVARDAADRLGIAPLAAWADGMARLAQPRKADQDRLDAAICVLAGILWRAGPAGASAMLGDLAQGYMVTPISAATRLRLDAAAARRGIPLRAAD